MIHGTKNTDKLNHYGIVISKPTRVVGMHHTHGVRNVEKNTWRQRHEAKPLRTTRIYL